MNPSEKEIFDQMRKVEDISQEIAKAILKQVHEKDSVTTGEFIASMAMVCVGFCKMSGVDIDHFNGLVRAMFNSVQVVQFDD